MMRKMDTVERWDFEGYWSTVIGARHTEASVIAEFGLVAEGLDEWLGESEQAALDAGVERSLHELTLEAWEPHHAQALAALTAAIEAQQ